MVNDRMDKAKLLAYVLGELDRDETSAIAKILERDPELKSEVLSLQKMTQKLDEAFVVSENYSLDPSQLQEIRQHARQRTTRKTWLIWMSAVASVMIVVIALIQQRNAQSPAEPVPQIIAQAPPPTFDQNIVPPPETSWERQLEEADSTVQIAAPSPAKSRGGRPSPPTSQARPSQNIIASQSQARIESTQSLASDSYATDAQTAAPTARLKKSVDGPDLRIRVDRRLSAVPAIFAANLLDILVQNLDGANECFQAEPLPPRVDMTVEVSGKGDILSVSLIPQVPQSEVSVVCLKKRINRAGRSLEPKSGQNASFEVRINLK